MIILICLISLLIALPGFINKAGYSLWKGFIPGYNIYLFFRIIEFPVTLLFLISELFCKISINFIDFITYFYKLYNLILNLILFKFFKFNYYILLYIQNFNKMNQIFQWIYLNSVEKRYNNAIRIFFIVCKLLKDIFYLVK